jgi:hypothetical protein
MSLGLQSVLVCYTNQGLTTIRMGIIDDIIQFRDMPASSCSDS